MSNPSGINPVGWRILLLPKEVMKETASGIIIATEQTKDREDIANTIGIVIDMGSECYKATSQWCKVGDKVSFAKHAGLVYIGKDGKKYRMVNDDDITGVLDDDVELIDPALKKGL